MGFFDRFKKKGCVICGKEIGFFGNNEVADGIMCNDCEAKLSRWFKNRSKTPTAQIKEQLAYREQNAEAVRSFTSTRCFGMRDGDTVHIDDNQGKFLVASTTNLTKENPDVLDISQVTGGEVDVKDSRYELKYRGQDGKQVSYNPPRYEYSYYFSVILRVNHPYFQQMTIKVNKNALKFEAQGGGGFFSSSYDPSGNMQYNNIYNISQQMLAALTGKGAPMMNSSMGMNQMGMGQMGMNQMGMNQMGMGQMGMNQMGMNQNQMGMNNMGGMSQNQMGGMNNMGGMNQNQQGQYSDSWTCSCGAVNTGRFCVNCGQQRS